MMWKKLRIHIVTLSRPFAIPFFGGGALIGSLLASGTLSELNTWLGFIAVSLLMAYGHSQNSFWDWKAGLDTTEGGSIGKCYTAGCRPIPDGLCSPKEVVANSAIFAFLGLIVCGIIAMRVGSYIFIPAIVSLFIPYLYTRGKFSWYHELMLASGVVVAVLLGAMSTGTGNYLKSMLVAIPISIIFSFAGLALDEWPDAKANLKKGVKSIAYKVYEYKIDLGTYLMIWFAFAYIFQTLLISIGILKSSTAITFVLVPVLIGCCVFLKSKVEFAKVAKAIVIAAACYPLLLLIGEVVG